MAELIDLQKLPIKSAPGAKDRMVMVDTETHEMSLSLPGEGSGEGGGSASITVDSELNVQSTNAIQNKAVAQTFAQIKGNMLSANDRYGKTSNIFTAKDVKQGKYWTSGRIINIGNDSQGSFINFESFCGDGFKYNNHIIISVTIEELKNRGVIVNDGDAISIMARGVGIAWLSLRYDTDDDNTVTSKAFDVRFNTAGLIEYFGSGDKETWKNASVGTTDKMTKTWKAENIKIPFNYKERSLYSIVLAIGQSEDGVKHLSNVAAFINKNVDEDRTSFNPLFDLATKENLEATNRHAEDNTRRISIIENLSDRMPEDFYWAAAGDSISNANHRSIFDIDDSDAFMPIDGYTEVSTYKRKNYAYYLAKIHNIKWANYGWGGTTLAHCPSKAYGDKNAFVHQRMYNLKENINWNLITIFFGGNDSYFDPAYHRELWLKERYGIELGYPVKEGQIGSKGFANAEQKAACDAVTGLVNGQSYDNNKDFFIAKSIGSETDDRKDTFMGALNVAVKYLSVRYPKAKIVLIASYSPDSPLYADAVVKIAKRWSLPYFDFRNVAHWPVATLPNFRQFKNTNREDGKWTTESGSLLGDTVYDYQRAKYLYDGTHPTNIGYKEMAYIMDSSLFGNSEHI